jgi:hypothetical protein
MRVLRIFRSKSSSVFFIRFSVIECEYLRVFRIIRPSTSYITPIFIGTGIYEYRKYRNPKHS